MAYNSTILILGKASESLRRKTIGTVECQPVAKYDLWTQSYRNVRGCVFFCCQEDYEYEWLLENL